MKILLIYAELAIPPLNLKNSKFGIGINWQNRLPPHDNRWQLFPGTLKISTGLIVRADFSSDLVRSI